MAGIEEMLAVVGRFVFSTGRGPSFTFGLMSNLLQSYGSSSYFIRSEIPVASEVAGLVTARAVIGRSGAPLGIRTSVVAIDLSLDFSGSLGGEVGGEDCCGGELGTRLSGTLGGEDCCGGDAGGVLNLGEVGVVALGVSDVLVVDCESLVDSSEVAYCVVDGIEDDIREVIDRCPESSLTRY